MQEKSVLDTKVREILSQAAAHPSAVAASLTPLHHVEAIEALNQLEPKLAAGVIEHLPADARTNLFNHPGLINNSTIMELLSHGCASTLLAGLNPDRRAEIFRNMDEDHREALREHLDPETRASIERIMAYPPDSAGGIMTTEFVAVPATLTAGQTIDRLRDLEPDAETIYYVYVVDQESRLVGVLSLRDLVIAPPETHISGIMVKNVIHVYVEDHADQVAQIIGRYNLLAVPVVSDDERLVGIITVDDTIERLLPQERRRRLPMPAIMNDDE